MLRSSKRLDNPNNLLMFHTRRISYIPFVFLIQIKGRIRHNNLYCFIILYSKCNLVISKIILTQIFVDNILLLSTIVFVYVHTRMGMLCCYLIFHELFRVLVRKFIYPSNTVLLYCLKRHINYF